MIHVTKPFLPPKEEYLKILDEIWERRWLTNNGPVLNDLELSLKKYLGLDHLLVLGNGTIAIQIAIKALELKGEIITTPFSYVATTSSIVWENCKPVFVDIKKEDFNIDPNLIEAAVTENTCAILATHVYGNPCEVEAIEAIAEKHKLKVIYDAAHCFGTKYKGKSIFEYGDISTTSFHATKIFNTVEGGAVFTTQPDLLKKMAFLRNFGHNGPEDFAGVGVNGKNSEFHAAMGLAILPYIDDILEKRKEQWLFYSDMLKEAPLQQLRILGGTEYNHSYFPIVFEDSEKLEKIVSDLNSHYIYPRRYFRPSLNTLNYTGEQDCPISESVSDRVLNLPLYHDLSKNSQELICRVVLRGLYY